MTADRYAAYCRLREELDGHPLLDDHERDLLRQLGEDLLLTRAHEEATAEERRQDAAVALSILVESEIVEDAGADRLWLEIAGCGPQTDGAPSFRAPVAH